MKFKTYTIRLYSSVEEMEVLNEFQTDNIDVAIRRFLLYHKKSPTMACIMCHSRKDAVLLCKYFVSHANAYLTEGVVKLDLSRRFIEYLYNEANIQASKQCISFREHKELFTYDMIHPFCLG